MEAVVGVLLHAPDRPFFLYLPFLLPGLEPLDGLPPAAGIEDVLGLGHTWLQVHPLQLDGHVPQLVNDAPLHLEKWVDLFECLQEGSIPVGGDKPQGFAQKPTALEVYQKARQLSVSSRSTSRKGSISLVLSSRIPRAQSMTFFSTPISLTFWVIASRERKGKSSERGFVW